MKPVYETINLVDDKGIELIVAYKLNKVAMCYEEGHGLHETEGGWEVTLESVELGIKGGKGIEVLPSLNNKQRENIENEILESL